MALNMTDFHSVSSRLPFLSIGLAVAGVLWFHRYLDRRARRQHAAE
jgi:hypothetical protein